MHTIISEHILGNWKAFCFLLIFVVFYFIPVVEVCYQMHLETSGSGPEDHVLAFKAS